MIYTCVHCGQRCVGSHLCNSGLVSDADMLRSENVRLNDKLAAAMNELAEGRADRDALRQKVSDMGVERRKLEAEIAELRTWMPAAAVTKPAEQKPKDDDEPPSDCPSVCQFSPDDPDAIRGLIEVVDGLDDRIAALEARKP